MLDSSDLDCIRRIFREELARNSADEPPVQEVASEDMVRLARLAQDYADQIQTSVLIIPAITPDCHPDLGSRLPYYVQEATATEREKKIAVKRLIPQDK